MGVGQSRDLKNEADVAFNKELVLMTLDPIFVVDETEEEDNLDTGNDQLNKHVERNIQICHKEDYLVKLIETTLHYKVVGHDLINGRFFITMGKHESKTFDQSDVKCIREFFSKYNSTYKKPVILSEEDAQLSSYFDDMGQITLGFRVIEIDYI